MRPDDALVGRLCQTLTVAWASPGRPSAEPGERKVGYWLTLLEEEPCADIPAPTPTPSRILRWVAAILILVSGAVHLVLWSGECQEVKIVGALFLLNVVAAVVVERLAPSSCSRCDAGRHGPSGVLLRSWANATSHPPPNQPRPDRSPGTTACSGGRPRPAAPPIGPRAEPGVLSRWRVEQVEGVGAPVVGVERVAVLGSQPQRLPNRTLEPQPQPQPQPQRTRPRCGCANSPAGMVVLLVCGRWRPRLRSRS